MQPTEMRRSTAVDGFRLAYDDHRPDGSPEIAAAVLLHGWPGDRRDFREVVPLLAGRCRVVVPDLRGFGESEMPQGTSPADYAAVAQARSVLGLIEELQLGPAVIAGYDVGSRIAQGAARARPDLVRALVVSPPLPGAGDRVLSPDAQREFWYQAFHRLELAEQLLDGNRAAVRSYLEHLWTHWSGPDYVPAPAELDRLADVYARPGAFVASINWYRSGSGTVAMSLAERPPAPSERIAVPTTVLWQEHDPLFPRAWSDRLDDYFADVQVRSLDGVGHFTPLEAPGEFADAVLERI
ncbi:alpha/beta fold hydrolase [Pseudonocardia alaniniphila]|uniref:Alpha/beta hydrolase n=1 Tax=Pseudonocardia alaniniphila TaxID=75291 RepID=A0ABS9TN43_9PSEU|nr:alpha/beta hydrolase [Pseudonocardia alaniniphila]MCH6169946.1 alpha/beta hydrolase [Pseudonocardia alaniniphila]